MGLKTRPSNVVDQIQDGGSRVGSMISEQNLPVQLCQVRNVTSGASPTLLPLFMIFAYCYDIHTFVVRKVAVHVYRESMYIIEAHNLPHKILHLIFMNNGFYPSFCFHGFLLYVS
jgi:hypothetical protein